MTAPARTSRSRRLRYTALTAVLLIAATASLVILNVLGSRFAARYDITSTREHELSPRSRALLGQLRGEYEIVVAGPLKDRRVVDPTALQRVADVLDQFKRAGGGEFALRPTLIDTGSMAGLEIFDQLVQRLTQRDADKIRRHQETISGAIAGSRQIADALDQLAPQLEQVRSAIDDASTGAATNRLYFEQRAGECRSSARNLRDLAARVETMVQAEAARQLPDLDAAAEQLRQPLGDLELGLSSMAADLAAFGKAEGIATEARDLSRGVAGGVGRVRDAAALLRDRLERLPRLDLVRIAKALQASSAVLVIGPPDVGLTGIEFEDLFPPTAVLDAGGGRADLGRRAEELLSTALAALAQPVKPIVVLVHGQSRGFFDKLSFFELMKQRLGLRGIDMVMWEAAVEGEPPPLSRLDPQGNRPVVYVVFNTASYAGASGGGPSGPERAGKLGAAVSRLVQSGKPVLMSIFPSTMPSYGEADPTTAWMAALGLSADSGRPLLRERLTPEGRRVDAFQSLRVLQGEHPLSGALRGLPTRLEWPIAIRETGQAPTGVQITPLYRVEDRQAWGESQWLTYMQIPLNQHASVPNPPSNDSSRDDAAGPWNIAVAVERRAAGLDQRLVIVGSNSWFSDTVMGEAAQVDGRIVAANPGNAELLEASVYWLARQDSAIAQSATARAVPLIRSLDPATRSLLRWGAIAGLPALVLALGAVWRVLRG